MLCRRPWLNPLHSKPNQPSQWLPISVQVGSSSYSDPTCLERLLALMVQPALLPQGLCTAPPAPGTLYLRFPSGELCHLLQAAFTLPSQGGLLCPPPVLWHLCACPTVFPEVFLPVTPRALTHFSCPSCCPLTGPTRRQDPQAATVVATPSQMLLVWLESGCGEQYWASAGLAKVCSWSPGRVEEEMRPAGARAETGRSRRPRRAPICFSVTSG